MQNGLFPPVIEVSVGLDGQWGQIPADFCQLLGYTPENLRLYQPKDIIHPDDFPMYWAHYQRLVRGEIERFGLQERYIHKDGKIVWVYVSCRAVTDTDGKPRHFVHYIHDITECKQLEEQLFQAREELESRVKQRTLELEAANRNLSSEVAHRQKMEKALRISEAELREQKIILEQKNLALQEILRQIEIEKRRKEEDVMANVERLILPIVKKFKRKGTRFDRRYIDLLEKNLDDLTSTFAGQISKVQWRLTPRETEICGMIKNGFPSKEIAGLLHVSHRTIEIHRHSIRRKLGITNKDINLTTYLQSFLSQPVR